MAERSELIPEPTRRDGMALGRHVRHDPRSLLFRRAAARTVNSVTHERRTPVLDQGQVGSCTGNAGTGALGTSPVYETLRIEHPGSNHTVLDEDYALALYGDATKIDSAPGTYPPDDTGSDGLAIMQVLKARGLISGYTAGTSVDEAKSLLQSVPAIIGIPWFEGFYDPRPNDAVVTIKGAIAGGHEIELTEWDAATDTFTCVNSWGAGWGDHGRFRFTGATFAKLLAQQGDVYAPVLLTEPAPTPAPVASIWPSAVIDPWLLKKHSGEGARVATALISLRTKLQS